MLADDLLVAVVLQVVVIGSVVVAVVHAAETILEVRSLPTARSICNKR